jgi:hypothetical protein
MERHYYGKQHASARLLAHPWLPQMRNLQARQDMQM